MNMSGASGLLKGLMSMLPRRRGRGSGSEEGRLDEFTAVSPLLPTNTNAAPIARSGHRVWTDGHYLYSIGGYNPDHIHTPPQDMEGASEESSPLLLEVWRLNLITDTWEQVPTSGLFPKTMASFAMCYDQVARQLLIFGGTAIPFGNTASNELHALSLRGSTAHWEELNLSGSSPEHGYGQAFVPVGPNDFYLIGGTSGFQYNMLVHRISLFRRTPGHVKHPGCSGDSVPDEFYSGESQSVLRGRQCEVRYRHEALRHNGRILVFGGGTREQCVSFKQLDALDLQTGEWGVLDTSGDPAVSEGEGYPPARRCHALVRHRNRAYIIGGFDGIRMFSDVWWLDLNGEEPHQWSRSAVSLPKPLYFHSADITPEGCVYVFGGVVDQQGTTRSSEVLRMWLEPPPLQWAALRSLLRAKPRLLHHSKESLRRMGIPAATLDWLKVPDNPA